ncbi:hypothetical protein [Nocardia amamiensis]|uniref:hypothetical protein n=1 Tax=Nocardia amamiensis TaxID=404578 RepID=UPI000B002C89|nr:hypothetical protein [Nocardia amamiensis]
MEEIPTRNVMPAASERTVICEVDRQNTGSPSVGAGIALRLCRDCITATEQRLAALPWLAAQCVGPFQWGYWDAGDGRRRDQRTLPLPSGAIALRVWISSILESWVDLVLSECPTISPPRRDTASTAKFLVGRIGWLAAHPSAADFVVEIGDLFRDVLRFVEREHGSAAASGKCRDPRCVAPVTVELDGINKCAVVRCKLGHRWTVYEWLSDERLISDPSAEESKRRTLPTKVAAEAFGIQEATIRQWAKRGRLTRYGLRDRAEYDIDEIAHLIHVRKH